MDQAAMKREWDERARTNILRAVDDQARTEEDFKALGAADVEMLLADVAPFLSRDAAVLEIGCGVGRLLEPLASRFREVWGVDVSREMVTRARARLAHFGNVRVLENNGSDLQGVPSDHFDFCCSAFALQHVPRRAFIQTYLGEAQRVLRHGGLLKLQVGGVYAINPFRSLYDESYADTWKGIRLTMGEIVGMAEESGFQMIAAYHAQETVMPRPEGKKQRRLWVVARHDRGMDEWESVCFSAGQALARVVPRASSVILPEPEMIDHLEIAGAKGVEFLSADPPADSADAIATIERLRARGGAYLLFSRYGRWWLDLYPELRQHLDERYRRVEDREECVIFDLRPPIG